jgi:hypothetical protein
MASAEPGTFDACLRTAVLPAISDGAAKRNTCQKGKFHGITASTGPSGWKLTKLLAASVLTACDARSAGPCSAKCSQTSAHFSTSARPWVTGLPISRAIWAACSRASERRMPAAARRTPARSSRGVRRQMAKARAASSIRAEASSALASGKLATTSPVAGFRTCMPAG